MSMNGLPKPAKSRKTKRINGEWCCLNETAYPWWNDAARPEVLEVGLQGGRVHGHEDVGLVSRGEDVPGTDVDLVARDAGQRARGGADLGGEVGEGGEVVSGDGRRLRELRADELHAVAGVPDEADGDAFDLLHRPGLSSVGLHVFLRLLEGGPSREGPWRGRIVLAGCKGVLLMPDRRIVVKESPRCGKRGTCRNHYAILTAPAAPSGFRKHLPGVQDPERIEGRLEAPLQPEDRRTLLVLEEVSLGEADPVLPGDGPAHVHRRPQDVGDGRLGRGPMPLAVEEHVAVEVPVPGVAIGGDEQAMGLSDLPAARDHLRDARAGHRDVLGELVPGQGLQRHRQVLAGLPDVAALGRVLGDDHLAGRAALDHLRHPGHLGEDLLLVVAVGLEEQRRSRAGRQLEGRAPGDGLDGHVVDELEAARDDPRGEHPAHRLRGGGHVGEADQRGGHVTRARQELDRHLGDDSQRPLAPHQERGEVVAGHALDGPPSHPEDLAGGDHHLEPEHVLPGDAVPERAGSPGVLGDVAADGAEVQRVGIGRVEEPVLLHLGLEHPGDHPGLDAGGEVGGADLEDAVHPLHRHPDPTVDGERTSRLPAARGDGHDRRPVARGDGEDRADLLRRLHLHHHSGWKDPQVRLVLAVLDEPFPVLDQAIGRECRAQLPDGVRQPLRRDQPNTSTSLPFIASGASAAHQPTTRATSSAPMAAGNGVWASMRVSTPPGETVITWTPEPLTSSARLLANPTSPHFDAL